jgi:hypothetical protein
MVVAVHRRRPGRPAASALQTTGELANTLVIFTSDNGFLDNATPPNVTFREYYYLPPTRTSSSTSWPTAFPATTRTPPPCPRPCGQPDSAWGLGAPDGDMVPTGRWGMSEQEPYAGGDQEQRPVGGVEDDQEQEVAQGERAREREREVQASEGERSGGEGS